MQRTPEEKEATKIVETSKYEEAALDSLFGYKGPTPQPTPPSGGMFTGPQPGQRMTDEAKAQKREAIRQEALKTVAGNEKFKNAPINEQVKAFKIVDAYAYPDTAPPLGKKNEKDLHQSQDFAKQQFTGKHKETSFKTMDETQRSMFHKMGYTDMRIRQESKKGMEQSQDFAMRTMGDEKEKSRSQPQKDAETFKGASQSFSFSQSLGYAKLNKPLDKSPDVQAPQKTEMSGKAFSDSLSYNKISKAPVEPSPTVASKFRENSIDMDI